MKNLFNSRSWLVTMLPAGVIISLGLFQFRDAVVHTVQLSPHPQIIYLIAGGFVIGLITLSMALHSCLSERHFLLSWSHKNKKDATEMLEKSSTQRSISPLLTVLSSMHLRAPQAQQEIIEMEVEEFDKALHQGLNFPAYISSTLIGLGLVGTFIGLLGSLQEMADIISGMMNTTSSGQSPFSEMLRKLKRPMEGMGTAFVASMYGLMGSLLLEWMLVSVRKVCSQVLVNVRQVIREYEIANAVDTTSLQVAPPMVAFVTSDQFLTISSELQANQEMLTRLLDKHQQTEQIWLKSQDEYVRAVSNRKLMDRATQELLQSMLKVNQETLQAQEINRQQAIQAQEINRQLALQTQEINRQQALQAQEAHKLQVQEFSRHLAVQFKQISVQTHYLNKQVAELNAIYRSALNKPSALYRIWTEIKSFFTLSLKLVSKK